MGLFGKKVDAGSTMIEEEEVKEAPEVPSASGADRRRKWGVIVVADSVVTLFFLGVLCFAVYFKFLAPPLPEVKDVKGGKSAKTAKADTAETAPAPAQPEAKAPEAAKPAEEPKKEAAAPAKEEKPATKPVGSPAVHATALPKRTAEPIPAQAAAKTEKAATPGAKPRAVAVEFTHKAPQAKEVLLRGAFLVRQRGRQAMVKDSQGVWHLSVSLLPGSYKYTYQVDNKISATETREVE